MKYRDPQTGNMKPFGVKVSDTLPIGTQVDYEGDSVPVGWKEIIDNGSVIVSATEPITDRKKVWLQHSKNLFDKDSAEMDNIGFSSSNGQLASANSTRLTSINLFLLKKGTYTLSFNTLNSYWILVYNIDGTFKSDYIQSSWESGNTKTFTLTEDNLIRISLRYEDNSNVAINDYNIQIEQGSSKNTYEQHVEDKTFILNDNDVYQEFKENNGIIDSNFNGTTSTGYIKYADGSLIQYGQVEMTTDSTGTTVAGITMYNAPDYTVSLPQSFINSSSFIVTLQVHGAQLNRLYNYAANKTSRATFHIFYSSTTASNTRTIMWQAIGRWK